MRDEKNDGRKPCGSATSYTSRINPRPLAVGRTVGLDGTHAERPRKGGQRRRMTWPGSSTLAERILYAVGPFSLGHAHTVELQFL
jgi:hypothetical protein